MGFLSAALAPGERRFHPSQDPPAWFRKVFGWWDTAAGINVTPENALQYVAVFAAVRILSESLASMPLVVYRRLDPRGKERARDHYLYPILHDLPNPEMTSFELRETLMGHLATWGNAYGEMAIDGGGRVREIWPLRPDKMRPRRQGQRLEYQYTLPESVGGQEKILPAERILHIRGLGFDGLMGYSPIYLARQSVGLGKAAEEFGARFFGNDARPGGVLEHPGVLGDEAYGQLKKSWEARHQGLERSHRIAILEEGMKYHEIGLPPQDAQFLETRKFQTTEIARLFRIPPHMLADLEHATFSNIEHQSLEFIKYTILPWMVRWEQAIYRSVLLPQERDQIFAAFVAEGLLRGDIESRYTAYSTGRQWGWLNADDVRELEDMNPLPDGQGEDYLVPLNMVPASSVRAPTLDGGESGWAVSGLASPDRISGIGLSDGRMGDGSDDRIAEGEVAARTARARRSATGRHRLAGAQQRVFEDVAARIIRREVNDVRNAARKFLGQRSLGEFLLWLGDFYQAHEEEFVPRMMGPVMASFAEMAAGEAADEVGADPDEVGDAIERFSTSYTAYFAGRHSTTSEEAVRETVRAANEAVDDPLEALDAEFESWEATRPAGIGLREAVRLANAASLVVYKAVGIVRKRWVAFGDNCPYCNDLNGRVIGVDEYFLEAGEGFEPDEAERPLSVSRNVGHAPAHQGCDCMIVAEG